MVWFFIFTAEPVSSAAKPPTAFSTIKGTFPYTWVSSSWGEGPPKPSQSNITVSTGEIAVAIAMVCAKAKESIHEGDEHGLLCFAVSDSANTFLTRLYNAWNSPKWDYASVIPEVGALKTLIHFGRGREAEERKRDENTYVKPFRVSYKCSTLPLKKVLIYVQQNGGVVESIVESRKLCQLAEAIQCEGIRLAANDGRSSGWKNILAMDADKLENAVVFPPPSEDYCGGLCSNESLSEVDIIMRQFAIAWARLDEMKCLAHQELARLQERIKKAENVIDDLGKKAQQYDRGQGEAGKTPLDTIKPLED